ncbi:uncharacterized protein BO97DRAFT_413315 [Aspergillus homomorphus CBS 101889]|uniref:Uncharacterized protein n=1 Tax=Aspergillus homomorphus (strain CBS 101889) TaxID=1450537 RepID=A0A395I0Z3_ASPHC|nr:hypothetical protein BO97DRAFT_413315 [Aspergillus homomorphus CBS 101889]RAL13730.1 hypothetical protein BO97DRAFT_413315 [Aspergillus homomorphus CBS 101889]
MVLHYISTLPLYVMQVEFAIVNWRFTAVPHAMDGLRVTLCSSRRAVLSVLWCSLIVLCLLLAIGFFFVTTDRKIQIILRAHELQNQMLGTVPSLVAQSSTEALSDFLREQLPGCNVGLTLWLLNPWAKVVCLVLWVNLMVFGLFYFRIAVDGLQGNLPVR